MTAVYFSQDVYLSKVKALLGKELNHENGSHVDSVEHNGKTVLSNGSHKDEHSEDVTMEEEEEAVKSPTASKGKGGRKSKTNSDNTSTFILNILIFVMKHLPACK